MHDQGALLWTCTMCSGKPLITIATCAYARTYGAGRERAISLTQRVTGLLANTPEHTRTYRSVPNLAVPIHIILSPLTFETRVERIRDLPTTHCRGVTTMTE